MKELEKSDLMGVEGGMPWLGLGNMNLWIACEIAEFVSGFNEGWDAHKK